MSKSPSRKSGKRSTAARGSAGSRKPEPRNMKERACSFEAKYPHTARWVEAFGWVEIGFDGMSSSFVRALDEGGMIWEGKPQYSNVNKALQALETAVGRFMQEQRLDDE